VAVGCILAFRGGVFSLEPARASRFSWARRSLAVAKLLCKERVMVSNSVLPAKGCV